MDDILGQKTAELMSGDEPTRCAAAAWLAQHADVAAPAAVALARACAASDEIRDWATSALESCGPPPVALLHELTHLLHDPHPDVSYWAATLIGRLGQVAQQAEAEVAACTANSPHREVRRRAAWALEQIRRSA
ncbi:MAG: HEAT repeat domain-containing protein [Pirellulales bacterium]